MNYLKAKAQAVLAWSLKQLDKLSNWQVFAVALVVLVLLGVFVHPAVLIVLAVGALAWTCRAVINPDNWR